MANHSSAPVREQAPHLTNINNTLKRRAQLVINDESIDPQTRALINSNSQIRTLPLESSHLL